MLGTVRIDRADDHPSTWGCGPPFAGVAATQPHPLRFGAVGVEQFTRARDQLLCPAVAEADLATVLAECVHALHRVTRFAACALMTVDPQTLLPTGGIVEGFDPETCGPFWDHELLAPGFNKFTTLARSSDTVATLYEATDGDLTRAPIYAHLYEPVGIADELRAAFVLGSTCWAVCVLVRARDDGPFPDAEIGYVRNLRPLIARLLKAAVCRLEADALGPAAMLVVDGDNEIEHRTVEAAQLLEGLATNGVTETGLPTVVRNVVTRARFNLASTHIATRVCGTSGRWLRVTAVPTESGDGHVAVMIEPARPTDLIPILLETYGLTEREVEIVVLLARGLATKEIAAELSVSTHTVRGHVKAIFEKVGVNSRGELVARLFSQHLLDAFEAVVHRGD
jgi:DNA-binding NarL/FixJ family response regulator